MRYANLGTCRLQQVEGKRKGGKRRGKETGRDDE
jgi:hypothetical protein